MQLLSVTMNDGVKLRSELDGKDNSSEDKSNYKKVCVGDMVYNSMRMWQGANGVSEFEGIVSPAYTVLKPEANINNEYFAKLFKNTKLINEFRKNSQGLTSDTWNLKYQQIAPIKIKIPEINEQNKIAEFLSLVDKRIDKQRQLVENLKKYKRGLLSAIFERKIRFKNDNGNDYQEWEKTPLGSIFNERTARADGNEELLAVTINEGIKKRNEIDLKDNSSDDKSNYKKVYIGDIAYNTMRMWQGASGVSKYNGIVSPAYTVISPSSEIDIEFFGYYFKYIKVIHIFQKFSQGLTSDTWNLKFPQFAEINLYLPSINEQKRIAAFLKSFDNKILNEEAFLNNLTKKKRGLLQQMFI